MEGLLGAACELSAGRIRPRSGGAALDLDPDPRRSPSRLRAPARDGTDSEQRPNHTSRAISVPPRGPFRRPPEARTGAQHLAASPSRNVPVRMRGHDGPQNAARLREAGPRGARRDP